jgi:GGDEF domain-containing protein
MLARNHPRRGRRNQAAREPSVSMLLLAALCLTAALILAAQEHRAAAIVATIASAGTLAIELSLMGLWDNRTNPSIIARLVAQAQAGRRLAIYDRETGLFAHWYLTLRGEEECARATRYDRTLSLLVIEPPSEDTASAWALKPRIGRWIQTELRATDIAGYVGNGRFVVLAPEADHSAIEKLVRRIHQQIDEIDVGISTFPQDGVTYDQLWRAALTRLREDDTAAA